MIRLHTPESHPEKGRRDMSRPGFTLIELLIVVAIIAILAAIATPNFVEAQLRSKVSRVVSDMRTMATAVEAYTVDWNVPPLNGVINADASFESPQVAALKPPAHKFLTGSITTPVAYLTSLPRDVFVASINTPDPAHTEEWNRFFYTSLVWFRALREPSPPPVIDQKISVWGPWVMASAGPDGDRLDLATDLMYDPTNGADSNGDIMRGTKRW
jgi:prepilin-type N-terminal cleavage/methylation domain-containing protein